MVNWYVWCMVLFVCLGGFIFGYDVGSVNGVKDMAGYRMTFNLSSTYTEDSLNETKPSCDSQDDVETAAILGLIVSLLSVGSLVGAIMSGFFSDKFGRKPVIIAGACLAAASGVLHTAAVNLWMVLLSRLIGGFGIGLLFQAVPLYVAEISPVELRGKMLCFFTTYAVTGTFIGTVVNIAVKAPLYGWRISLGIQFLLGALLASGMLLLPRSPRWLVKKHKDERALKVLTKIFKDQGRAQTQLEEIKATVSSTPSNEPFLHTLKYIFRWTILQRVLIGIAIMVFGRFTGLNFIGYFSVSLFCGIGLPGFAVSIALAGVCIVALLLAVAIVDKVGRKPLFLMGLSVMFVAHIASAVIILAFKLEDIAEGVTVSQTVAGYFVLVLQCVFLGSATMSVGNVSWVTINEMFPIKGRGFMTSICNAAFWGSLIAVNQVSPVLVSSPFRISGTLFFFATVSFAQFVFILLAVPETKGYTLEGMEEVFSKPWAVRTNVCFYLRCGCFLELVRKRSSRNYHLLDVPEEHSLQEVGELDEGGGGGVKEVEETLGSVKDVAEADVGSIAVREGDSASLTQDNQLNTSL